MKNRTIDFEITNHIGTLSTANSGWTKELNEVSWNGGTPKYDLSDWSPNHTNCGKGNCFSPFELVKLFEILKTVYGEDERK